MTPDIPVVSETSERRPRMSAQQRRAQLIRIGSEVFAERGYEATSVEEIAERAKVSKPVIYEHFGGKEGLYAVIVDREVSALLERITIALTADHPRAALEQAAEAFLSYIEEERNGFRVLVRDTPLGTAGGTITSVIGDIAGKVEQLLARQFKHRGFDRSHAPVVARALVGMVAMTGEWWLEVGKPSRKTVAAQLVNLAWNGLKDLDPDPLKTRKREEKKRRKGSA